MVLNPGYAQNDEESGRKRHNPLNDKRLRS